MNYTTQNHAPCGQQSSWTVRAATGLLGHMQRIRKALDDRRSARQLYNWSIDELKDIGVSRADVDREVQKPIRLW